MAKVTRFGDIIELRACPDGEDLTPDHARHIARELIDLAEAIDAEHTPTVKETTA